MDAARSRHAAGSATWRVRALTAAAWLAGAHYAFDEGRVLCDQALDLAREHGDDLGVAMASFVLGIATYHEGDLGGRGDYWTRRSSHFALWMRSGRAAWALCYLASLDSRNAIDEGGDPRELAHAIFSTRRRSPIPGGRADQGNRPRLARYRLRRLQAAGDARALATTREVLALDGEHGWAVCHYLEDIADIAGRIGRPETAGRLYGAAEAQRERIGRPIEPVYQEEFEQDVAVARRALGEAAFAAAWAEGRC